MKTTAVAAARRSTENDVRDEEELVGKWEKGDIVRIPTRSGDLIFLLISAADKRGIAIWLDKFGFSERLVDKRCWTHDADLL